MGETVLSSGTCRGKVKAITWNHGEMAVIYPAPNVRILPLNLTTTAISYHYSVSSVV